MCKQYNICDYGAKPEHDDNRTYIQRAIDAAKDGGVVLIPKGTFLTSTVYLQSNITLWLAEGAVLKAMPDPTLYDTNGFFDSFGQETNSFMIARGAENIAIGGRGTIDLSASAFMDFSISDGDRAQYGIHAEDIPAKPGVRIRRPILFDNCDHIQITDIKLMHAPCWTVTCNNCRDINIHSVTIENDIRAPHSDGIHLCGCDGAIISKCHIQSGDDCIAVTCLLDDTKRCRNILISDCILRSRSAGVRIGHMSSRVENVILSNLIIRDSNRGLAIFAGDRGYVENVCISNIIMDTHIYAGGWWGKGEPFVITASNSTGQIRNVRMSHIIARSENIGVLTGNLSHIRILDLSLDLLYTEKRCYARTYDILPNGTLPEENTFSGKYFTDCPDAVTEI